MTTPRQRLEESKDRLQAYCLQLRTMRQLDIENPHTIARQGKETKLPTKDMEATCEATATLLRVIEAMPKELNGQDCALFMLCLRGEILKEWM